MYVDELQAEVALVPGNSSLEETLYPAILEAGVPEELEWFLHQDRIRQFVLSGTYGPTSAIARDWSQSEAVQNLLTTLRDGLEPDIRAMLSLPYGKRGVDRTWQEAGLMAPLGAKDVILGVQPEYVRGLMIVHLAAVTDAWVQSSNGDGAGDEGLERFVDLIEMYRLLMDRATAKEVQAGMDLAGITFEHLRDCVAVHWEDGAFTADGLAQIASDLDERRIDIRRVEPPRGGYIGARQILDRAFVPRGTAQQQSFGELMAIADASDHPLQLFNSYAIWSSIAQGHAGTLATEDMIDAIWGDVSLRWTEQWHSEYLENNGAQLYALDAEFRLVHRALAAETVMQNRKWLLETESGGARLSLGVIGYQLDNDSWPIAIESVQNYVTRVDLSPDWFNYNTLQRRHTQMRFFVPVRDRLAADERLEVEPHVMGIATHLGRAELERQQELDAAEHAPFDYDSALATVRSSFPLLADFLTHTDLDAATNPHESALLDELSGAQRQRYDQLEQEAETLALDPTKIGDLKRVMNAQVDIMTEAFAERAGFGSDPQVFRTFTIESIRRSIISAVRSSGQATGVTDDQLLEMMGVSGLFDDSANAMVGGFTVSLNESNFVLYSVGADETDDGGVFFGPGVGLDSVDLLFWPPALTLERQAGVYSGP